MSKGSRPRPFSISQEEMGNRLEGIFGKKPPRVPYVYVPPEEQEMTPSVKQMEKGTCGCGRSPTGNCIGWHSLTEEAFQARLAEFKAQQVAANK